MTDSCSNPDELREWLADGDGAASTDAAVLAAFDADGGPALARQFRITDMQHWIDLCA